MKRIGAIGISLAAVLTIVGGVAVAVWTNVTWTIGQIAPVAAETNSNQTAIAALSVKIDDTNQKVNAIYNRIIEDSTQTYAK